MLLLGNGLGRESHDTVIFHKSIPLRSPKLVLIGSENETARVTFYIESTFQMVEQFKKSGSGRFSRGLLFSSEIFSFG